MSGLGSGGSYGEWGVWYVKKSFPLTSYKDLNQTNYINTYPFCLVYYNIIVVNVNIKIVIINMKK